MPVRFIPHEFKFHTKLACEIVEIVPRRLNEAIAAKDGYKCAPKTSAGVARLYGEFDLVALYLFRFLTDLGYSQSLASMYACSVKNTLGQTFANELPDRVDFPLNPFPDEAIACKKDDPTIFEHSGNLVSFVTVGFNLSAIREEIRTRMEHIAKRERSTFGED